MKRGLSAAISIATVLAPALALAQEQASSQQTNEANNPLTPKITVNFQDQWAQELYDSDEDTNAFLLRGLLPHRLSGLSQLFRFTLPTRSRRTIATYTSHNSAGARTFDKADA